VSSSLFAALVYEDKDATSTIEQLMQDPSLFSEDTKLAKGYTQSTWWLKIELGKNKEDVFVYFNQSNLKSVIAYAMIDGRIDIQKNGYEVLPQEKKVWVKDTVFKYEENHPEFIYVKVQNDFVVNLSYEILDTYTFYNTLTFKKGISTFLLAAIILLLFYNLILWRFSSDKVYGYYSLHLLGITLIIASFTNEFFGELYSYSIFFGSLGEGFAIVFSLLFLRTLYFQEISKSLHKFVDVLIWVGGVRLIVGLFFPVEAVFISSISLTPITLTVVLAINYVAYRQKHPIALYTLVAWSMMVFGAIVTQATMLGFIEDARYLMAFAVGATLEGVVFSVPLAYRLKLLQDQKHALQEIINTELSEEKKQKEQELKELNENLEATVQKQVKEIQEKEHALLAQQRLVQMGELLQMIAHQWRQPLNNLSITLQMFVKKIKNGKYTQEWLKETQSDILSEVFGLSQTIDDFQHYFAPSKEAKKFNLKELIDDTFHVIDHAIQAQRIKVENSIDENLEMIGYRGEIGQALLVIITNAKDQFEHIDVAYKAISITSKIEGENIFITISDTAGGIPDDVMPKIFDPYFTTKGDLNGAGIGLYMVKMMIEQSLKGKVKAYNNGNGACFEIMLPMGGG